MTPALLSLAVLAGVLVVAERVSNRRRTESYERFWGSR